MDPTDDLCRIRDTLTEPPLDVPDLPMPYTTSVIPVSMNITTGTSAPPVYVDVNRYTVLQRLKDSFQGPAFSTAKKATNLYESLGNSIFLNRAGVKLANTDAIYHLVGDWVRFDHQTDDRSFSFCDIAAGPGGFTKYIQWRLKRAVGYGMTLKHKTLDWDPQYLDTSRFDAVYGPDKTGDLYVHWEFFINHVLERHPEGVDLVTGDGGFDIEEGGNYDEQEFLSSRLLLVQSLVGISCCREGGNFMVKVFDTVTAISAQTIFALALCFEEVTVFKPISSRPANAERYVVCKRRRSTIEVAPCLAILRIAAQSYKGNEMVTGLFLEDLPDDFVSWLTEQNEDSIDRQETTAKRIIAHMNGEGEPLSPRDITKCFLMWNIPDNPVRRKR